MQRIERNGGLCHGEQKANSHNSGKNGLKIVVVVVVVTRTSLSKHDPGIKMQVSSFHIPTSFCFLAKASV